MSTRKKLKKVWDESKLERPKRLIAVDQIKKIYFVVKDDSTIVRLMNFHKGEFYSYVIPKKYFDEHTYYLELMNKDKLTVVSCRNIQDDYEEFILEKLKNFEIDLEDFNITV